MGFESRGIPKCAARAYRGSCVKRMPVVEKITSLSGDNIRRNYPHLVVKLSPRRDGMKLKNALAIADGTAKRRA